MNVHVEIGLTELARHLVLHIVTLYQESLVLRGDTVMVDGLG